MHVYSVAGGDIASDAASIKEPATRLLEGPRVGDSRFSPRRHAQQQPRQHERLQRGDDDSGLFATSERESQIGRKMYCCSLLPNYGVRASSSEPDFHDDRYASNLQMPESSTLVGW